jgi:hypothetical protein
MLDKDDLLAVMLKECDICVHLFGKLAEGALAYRPTPAQRSTLELLRYLTYCGIGGARVAVEGSYDSFKRAAARAADMPGEEFPAAMERQKRELSDLFASLTDGELATREAVEPTGDRVKLARAMLDMPLRWLTGYRMQLFLYAKAAGNDRIGTANCWAGIDWPRA